MDQTSTGPTNTGQQRHTAGNPLALAVLAFLTQRPMHPYEIGRLLKERSLHHSLKYRHSSLYTVIEKLHRDGYIAAQQTTREGRRPERTTYVLTNSGRAELRRQMRHLVAVPAKEYRQFEAALALIVVLPPDEVPNLLDRRQTALAEQERELRDRLDAARAEDVDEMFVIEYEYRLALVEAERAFIRRLTGLIHDSPPGFGVLWRDLHRVDRSRSAE